jgi:hypothetical protein
VRRGGQRRHLVSPAASTPSGSCSLAGPSRAPATAILWDRCRGVREESTPGRHRIEMEVCGHWACTAWALRLRSRAWRYHPRNPAMRDFDAGGIRSAPPTTLAATDLNAPQSERWGRLIAGCPSIRQTEEVAGRLGEGRWGRIQHRYCGSSDPPDAQEGRAQPSTGPSGQVRPRRLGPHSCKRRTQCFT